MMLRRGASSRRLLPLLCLVAIAAATVFAGTKLMRGDTVDADILSLLPASQGDPPLAAALHRLNTVASSRIALMLDGATPQARAEAAAALSDQLVAAGLFRPSAEEGKQAWSWFFAHRTTLLCAEDRARLEGGAGASLAQDALIRWYSPVGISNSALLKTDPMLLTPRLMSCLLGQLAANGSETSASIVSGSITAPVFDTGTQDRLKAVLDAWRAAWPEITLSRAGAIFHAEHAAAGARFQMSLISAATGLLILVIYLLMFRSLRPPLLAIALILSCLMIGLAATFLFYDRIHVMVIVFASALIGMVVDYSTYYLITGIARPSDDAETRRRSIFRPLTLGMVTSVAAFFALLASPIPAFRQIAILGSVGLFSAWALALYLLPALEGRHRAKAAFAERAKFRVHQVLNWRARAATGVALIGATVVIATVALAQRNVLDDVRRFQTPAPALAAEEAHIRATTGFAMPSAFILVTGPSDEEQRRNEEALLAKLPTDDNKRKPVILAATQFDPSRETADAQRALINAALEKDLPSLLRQLNAAPASPYSGTSAPASLPDFVGALRGHTGPVFWSIVPLSAGAAAMPGIATLDGPQAKLVDPAAAYSALLGDYRWTASLGLMGATVTIGVTLLLVYRRLSALWILLPTVLAMVAAPALLAIIGMPYSFFSAMALFLVIGAGVDYSIFQWEHRGARAPWTQFGISLAALMTCTSIGLLGLSSIYPVASFGLTVALGIFLSLILSPLVSLGFAKETGDAA